MREGEAGLRQGDLFAEPARDMRSERHARLWAAIDAINADETRKFARLAGARGAPGKRYVTLARQHGLDLNYLGAKIAFSRVPEAAEFLY
jgi:DNA polymerase-4